MEDLSPPRLISLFESIILEEQVRNAQTPEDGRATFKAHMQTLKQGGTIDYEEFVPDDPQLNPRTPSPRQGWTNDAPYRQPSNRIEPTEAGYPGLEPPVG